MELYNNYQTLNYEVDAIIESLDLRDSSDMDVIYEGFGDTMKRISSAATNALKNTINTVLNAIGRAINKLLNLIREKMGKETKEYRTRTFVGKIKDQGTKTAEYYRDKSAARSALTDHEGKNVVPVSVITGGISSIASFAAYLSLMPRSKENAQAQIDSFYSSENYKNLRAALDGNMNSGDYGAEYNKAHSASTVKSIEASKDKLNKASSAFNKKMNEVVDLDEEACKLINTQMLTCQSLANGLIRLWEQQF